MTDVVTRGRISRVVLRNYRSIEKFNVELGSLTFLVGPNGSGKSNFLDSLRLVGDALRVSLDHALRERSSIAEVRRRSSGHPTHFGIRLKFNVADGRRGHYFFEVGARSNGGFFVKSEQCQLGAARFQVEEGEVKITTEVVQLLDDSEFDGSQILALASEQGDNDRGRVENVLSAGKRF